MKSKNRINEGNSFATMVMYLCVAILCLIALYPMYYVLIMSLSSPEHIARRDVFFFPKGFNLETYGMLMGDMKMWKAYGNTFIYVIATTIMMLITSVLGAYPLTVRDLYGRKYVVTYLIIPMYFGGGLIPTFLLMTKLGLYDNMWAIIIPGGIGIWNIILTRTYFASISETIREAAKIDGASHFQILTKIYIHISKPILAVIAIYTVVGVWNSWFGAMVYLPSEEFQPLQLYLRRILIEFTVDLTTTLTRDDAEMLVQRNQIGAQLRYAMIIFSTLPVIFAYPFFQRHFVKGVMIGSLKG